MHTLICFTSDFGYGDTWVGMCHAVIYRACPQARVVDLAHDVPAFDIRKAAAVAAAGVWQLPDAIHLVVADPGVGGGRRDLVIVTKKGSILVGPDNGVLIPATWRSGGIEQAYSVTADRLDFKTPLPTFHARDVLAPVAAVLACGVDPSAVGDAVDPADLAPPPFQEYREEPDGLLTEAIDVDRFGSVRLAVPAETIIERGWDSGTLEFMFGHLQVAAPFGRTFSDVAEGAPVALLDSSGWLTLAVRLGSAQERYGVEPGAVAHIHHSDGEPSRNGR